MPKAPKTIARGDWWIIKAAAETPETAEILIYGDIGESWYGDSVTAKAFVEQIAAVAASEITVRINSFGGSVSDGIAIYNAIKRHPATVTVEIDGVAYSIASLIAMAGDRVRIAGNALMMIHAPWGMCAGNSEEMRQYADILDTYAEAMASSYMAKSGKSRDDVLALLTDGKDHYYTADQAIAEGFADETYNAMPVAASLAKGFDLSRYSRPPAGRSSTSTEKPTMATPANAAGGPEKPETPAITAAERQQIEAKAREEALAADAARREEIETLFLLDARAHAGASEAMLALKAECLKNPNMTPDAVGKLILAKRAEGVQPVNHPGHAPRVEAGITEGEKFVAAALNSIRARCGFERRETGNPFMSYSLLDLARASLELRGMSVRGMTRQEIAKSALRRDPMAAYNGNTTSDFPVLLENVLNKELLAAYTAAPDVWSKICVPGSASDFREQHRLIPGSISDIDVVNEAGEYLRSHIPDTIKEVVVTKRQGRIIAVTPEVLINDDLGFFRDVPRMFGRAAKRTIEKGFFALLTSNSGVGPTMREDNLAMFHATHGNYVTTTGAGAPSVTTISAGRQAMASQKDPSGNEILDIVPAIWLGPQSLLDTARVVNNSAYDPDAANKLQRVNAVAGLFREVIGTARLTGTGWYMFADPADAPAFEVTFLEGQTEPVLTQEEEFETAGLAWRVELPHAVNAVGWRGAYYNDGASGG